VVRPANEPELKRWSCWLIRWRSSRPAAARYRPRVYGQPQDAQWAEQGVYIIARPWPQVGPLFTKPAFTLDFAEMQVTCPGAQTVHVSKVSEAGHSLSAGGV